MVLSWNCQGLGNPSTVRALKDLLRAEDPEIVFLSETRMTSKQMEKVKFRLDFDAGVFVDRVGMGGGLAMLWKNSVDLTLRSFSKYHIDVMVEGSNDRPQWRLTGFYGEPNVGRRNITWNLLRRLACQCAIPWCCLGDFNEILEAHEKEGGAVKSSSLMKAFQDALLDCDLFDIGYVGGKFTWKNGHKDNSWTRLRLDRAVVNSAWRSLFEVASCHTLFSTSSDHLPILVDWARTRKRQTARLVNNRSRIFRFENVWSKERECGNIITRIWVQKGSFMHSSGQRQTVYLSKLARTRKDLGRWGYESFRQRSTQIKVKERILHGLLRLPINGDNASMVMELRDEIQQLRSDEEKYWAQRSRIQWLRLGDANTKFFHNAASQRKKNNWVESLVGEDGQRAEDMHDMTALVNSFYAKLFQSEGCRGLDDIFLGWHKGISVRQSRELKMTYSAREVEIALSQMAPDKAPGPDGMPPGFFQKFWGVVGEDVTCCVLEFLNKRSSLKDLNSTLICLIPKVQGAERMKDFRPISLCNTVYKLASKVIANRLKRVLSDVISVNQSAFVPQRLITDNTIVAFETLHSLRYRYTGREGWYALKLDMAKAYDRVEWAFLRKLLLVMRFPIPFINLVMECVTSVQYSVVLNGQILPKFVPSRGLRQGDPLSPYLFVLVTEVFSFLISNAQREGLLDGVAVTSDAPCITHLFFADDSLLFGKVNSKEIITLQGILTKYGEASGQKINFDKSNVLFSSNTRQEDRHDFCSRMGVMEVQDLGKYLGMPTHVGRSKLAVFECLKDRVWASIHCWNNKFLSQAGKEMLIKSVAQSLPVFYMSCFKIPVNVIEDLDRLISRFWWGKLGGTRGIHWTRWMNLCTSKLHGGMGFRNFACFNDALLAKQGWRIIQKPESLVGRLLRAKYFPGGTFIDANMGRRPSFIWRSMCHAKSLLLEGLRWRIGNGVKVRVCDRWIPRPTSFKLSLSECTLNPEMKVNELIDWGRKKWRADFLHSKVSREDLELIKSIPISLFPRVDKMVWHYTKHGQYSVRSGYHVAMDIKKNQLCVGESSRSNEVCRFWRVLWSLHVPPKVKQFIWRACHDMLPVRANLNRRGMRVDIACPICCEHDEDVIHALLLCPAARVVWFASPLGLRIDNVAARSLMDWLAEWVGKVERDEVEIMVMVAWGVWSVRNSHVHDALPKQPEVGMQRSLALLAEFKEARTEENNNARTGQGVVCSRWVAPPVGSLKLNCDASVKHNGYIGVGFVVRDHDGCHVASGVDRIMGNLGVVCAESMAIRTGLQFLIQRGCDQLIVESDCKEVIDMLKVNTLEDCSYLSTVVDDCLQLARRVRDISFVFVPRSCNRAAHVLAGLVQRRDFYVPRLWTNSVHPILSTVIANDSAN